MHQPLRHPLHYRLHQPIASLRDQALSVLLNCNPDRKAEEARAADASLPACAHVPIDEPDGIPGRPDRPMLVPHTEVRQRSAAGTQSRVAARAALIHAIAHVELNAIDLAADVVWRFADMPDGFYRDWFRVMQEEALHFQLLRDHLAGLGYAYGDFPAHNALWEMAERTRGDVLARVALVPRTLEARGLDASPAVRSKLLSAGDKAGAAIIAIILEDEIGHVRIGNRWYAWLCEQRGLDPIPTYAALTSTYDAPRLRGPFNLEARRAAGFSAAELDALNK